MYYALAAELRAVLERDRACSLLGSADSCGAGLGSGLAFGEIFASLVEISPANSAPMHRSEKPKNAFKSSSEIIRKVFQSIFR